MAKEDVQGAPVATATMNVVKVALDDLHPDPANARTHNDRNIEAIRASLKQFGQQRPLVVQESTGRIVAGNGTYAAMRLLGWTHCDVVLADMSDTQAVAFGIADNRTSELAEWDLDVLAKLVEGLKTDEFNVDELGFDEEDLRDLMDDPASDVLDVDALHGDDDTIEPPAVPVTKAGDIWQMGEHRLMCGDSTSSDAVRTLMAGALADVVFTSPPYDQQRDYGAKIGDWAELMRGVFAQLPVTELAQVLVNLGLVHKNGEWVPYWDPWITWMRDQGWRRFGWYVWNQGGGMPGSDRGRLAQQHEFVFHFNKATRRTNKTKACKTAGEIHGASGQRNADGTVSGWTHAGQPTQPTKINSSIVTVNRASGGVGGHPAPFPVGLPAEFYAAFSNEGQVAYEPFAGSGTSILAAEQIGRQCYAMEIEPGYCDIAVARWEKLTGKKATRQSATPETKPAKARSRKTA